MPLANVGAAQRELTTQLREVNRFPAAAAQRLAVLEALREAVSFVQIEQARRFSNRALPMSEAEAAAFTASFTSSAFTVNAVAVIAPVVTISWSFAVLRIPTW